MIHDLLVDHDSGEIKTAQQHIVAAVDGGSGANAESPSRDPQGV
jgi:hypothetical protein